MNRLWLNDGLSLIVLCLVVVEVVVVVVVVVAEGASAVDLLLLMVCFYSMRYFAVTVDTSFWTVSILRINFKHVWAGKLGAIFDRSFVRLQDRQVL